MNRLIVFIAVGILSTACVSSRVHKELQQDFTNLDAQFDSLTLNYNALEADYRELSNALNQLTENHAQLKKDSADMRNKLNKLDQDFTELSRSYDFLLENNKSLLQRSTAENRSLLNKLQRAQDDLASREDSLKLERNRIESMERNLQQRERQINELEQRLSQKDSLMTAVRDRISEALLSFEGKGLSVDMRNGNVYVTLENALLFKSASWDLDTDGERALKSLAEVLGENSDLEVLVEGHTDADAYRGRGQVKDNWDLSVMRATSIIRELTKNTEVDASRLTAAGRSEYRPLTENDTPENKAKNRRTEIIITPKLDELSRLMEDLK